MKREGPAAPKSHVSQQVVPVFLEAPGVTLGDAWAAGEGPEEGKKGQPMERAAMMAFLTP